MTVTKREYKLIAEAIRTAPVTREARAVVAVSVMNALRDTSKMFDPSKFLEDCSD